MKEEKKETMKRKRKYEKDLPRQMYSYFITYGDTAGAPSYEKFARHIGVTLDELEGYRRHSEFDRAYRECGEIRRDYLIDGALTKRYDASVVKFILSTEFGMGEKEKKEEDTALAVTLEVLTDR